MKPTVSYVKDRFDHFNRLCFKGELPDIPVRITNARSYLGIFVHQGKNIFLNPHRKKCYLAVSARMDIEERCLEDIIIHEMIHYYIWWRNLHDSSPHGPLFRSMMKSINAAHGRKISVSHRTSPEESDSDLHHKNHYICLSRWKDGRVLITLCARTRIFSINRAMTDYPMIESVEWYWSSDPFFNRYPVSRTPKVYNISPEDIRLHLAKATRCICTADRFQPAR